MPLRRQLHQLLDECIQESTEPLQQRITALESENTRLSQQLSAVNEKYLRAHQVLREKGEEWRKIKEQLIQYKSLRKILTQDESVSIDLGEETQMETEEETDLSNSLDRPSTIGNTTSNPSIPADGGDSQNTELDALIDILSQNEAPVSPTIDIEFPSSKRKAHKRGCPCCERFFKATRSAVDGHGDADADSYFPPQPSTPPGFWDVNFTPRA